MGPAPTHRIKQRQGIGDIRQQIVDRKQRGWGCDRSHKKTKENESGERAGEKLHGSERMQAEDKSETSASKAMQAQGKVTTGRL
jgi:hypothetical protein